MFTAIFILVITVALLILIQHITETEGTGMPIVFSIIILLTAGAAIYENLSPLIGGG